MIKLIAVINQLSPTAAKLPLPPAEGNCPGGRGPPITVTTAVGIPGVGVEPNTVENGVGEPNGVGVVRTGVFVAVEGVFSHKNARSALILGHARGVALLLAAQAGLDVHEYAPARVKRAVGAGGNDGKEAVGRMVCAALKIEARLERADAYDALAVALCHLSHARIGLIPMGPKKTPHRKAALAAFSSRLQPSYRREAVR